jgi:hypothetical protein
MDWEDNNQLRFDLYEETGRDKLDITYVLNASNELAKQLLHTYIYDLPMPQLVIDEVAKLKRKEQSNQKTQTQIGFQKDFNGEMKTTFIVGI